MLRPSNESPSGLFFLLGLLNLMLNEILCKLSGSEWAMYQLIVSYLFYLNSVGYSILVLHLPKRRVFVFDPSRTATIGASDKQRALYVWGV